MEIYRRGMQFSEGVLRQMIRDKFQVEPSIEYYDAPVVVDNVTSEIIADGGIPNQGHRVDLVWNLISHSSLSNLAICRLRENRFSTVLNHQRILVLINDR